MNDNIKNYVTVVLPVYNAQEWLPDCLACIKNQTYKGFELIIIDNCSTDSTKEICRQFEADNSNLLNIRVIYNPKNIQLSGSVEVGLDNCKTEHVFIAHADDLMSPQLLELGNSYLNSVEGNVDIVYVGKASIPLKKDVIYNWNKTDRPEMKEYTIDDDSLLKKWNLNGGCSMQHMFIKLELLRKADYKKYKALLPEKYLDDGVFSVELHKKAQKYASIQEVLYVRRERVNSEGRGKIDYARTLQWLKGDLILMDLFEEWKEIELRNRLCVGVLNNTIKIRYEIDKLPQKEELIPFLDSTFETYYKMLKGAKEIKNVDPRVRFNFALYRWNQEAWCKVIGRALFK